MRRSRRAFELVVQTRVERIDVRRQLALAPQVVPDVFVAGLHVFVGQPQLGRERRDEALGVGRGVTVGVPLVGEERRIAPDRLAVGAPVAPERPARQLLARIPLALAEVDETAGGEALLQTPEQIGGAQPFGRPERRRGSTRRHRDPSTGHERRLAAHRQPHVLPREVRVDRAAECRQSRPTVRRCTAW